MSRPFLKEIVSLLALSACEAPLSNEQRPVTGAVRISRVSTIEALGVVGPYVSVIDSVALVVVPSSDGGMVLGRRLAPSDTLLSFPLTLPKGVVAVSVKVLSNNGAVLYTGSVTSTIDRDGFNIRPIVVPVLPILVVAPDVATLSVNERVRQVTRVTIHNSGSQPLNWSVDALDTAFVQCNLRNPATKPCTATPAFGTVPPNGDSTLTLAFPIIRETPYFQSAQVFSFVIRSAQGVVTVRWRYP